MRLIISLSAILFPEYEELDDTDQFATDMEVYYTEPGSSTKLKKLFGDKLLVRRNHDHEVVGYLVWQKHTTHWEFLRKVHPDEDSSVNYDKLPIELKGN